MRTGYKLVLLSALLAGFAGGLVLSGSLSLTTPSVAAPEQTPTTTTSAGRAALASNGGALPDLSTIAENALRVSVNVTSTIIRRVPQDPFWQFWNGDMAQPSQSLGSGVIVSSDGYILTNTHVIGNAGAAIQVTLPGGRETPAKLVGIDDVSDLAVVKVDGRGLPTLPWGDSSKLRVAEWVLAVGNPFQLTGTVTLGIVSTVARSAEEIGSSQDFIQTDAAINPGNSGGALVSGRGELVGINTMIIGPGANVGIGFAIPSNAARRIMDELIKNGTVSWGSIGDIRWVTIDRAAADWYGLNVTGAYVRSIARNSSAYRAGLEPGDIVVTLDGQPVTTGDQIDRAVTRQKIGSTVTVGVVRGGRKATVEIPVTARRSNN